jgi:pantoate--beta-alanine ligase
MTPKVVRRIAELREEIAAYRRARADAQVGLVPTMGYLHEGHASLIRRSAKENGLTVLSVFVNPIQFGPNEDYDRYPRDEARDLQVAEEAGADLVFMPSVTEMYPEKPRTTVRVTGLTERLCGASRPGHFDGVATVVSKLLHIVQPDRAYFGLKDAQQVAVISQMAADLNFPAEIVPCPIVREPDGLAMSSRNVYLGPEERRQALILSQTLSQVPGWIEDGMTEAELIVRIRGRIRSQPLAEIEYAEVATYPDLGHVPADRPLRESREPLLVALAVRFGKTRLIDNVLLSPPEVNSSCFGK